MVLSTLPVLSLAAGSGPDPMGTVRRSKQGRFSGDYGLGCGLDELTINSTLRRYALARCVSGARAEKEVQATQCFAGPLMVFFFRRHLLEENGYQYTVWTAGRLATQAPTGSQRTKQIDTGFVWAGWVRTLVIPHREPQGRREENSMG